ncbi:MAG: hypothetical protein GX334_01615 [Firmicutes bacterium]|nr:hypothetical protein [Bacillota bacterium]
MDLLVKREIETTEPVQWAIDLLEKVIGFYAQEDVSEDYWERLLREKKREVMEDFYALAPSSSRYYHGLGYCEGFDGGRMLVLRILMDALPPYRALDCCRGKYFREAAHQLKTFAEITVYLKTLHISHGGDRALWRNAFFSAVNILLTNGYAPDLFNRGGWPVLVIAPPYREKTAACYLFNPHTLVLYSYSGNNTSKRTFLILHEMGHLLFSKYLAGKPLPETFTNILANLSPADYPQLIRSSSQGITETFANLFAMAMMYGTGEGNELFRGYYKKMGETAPLLKHSFQPTLLLQTVDIGDNDPNASVLTFQ